MLVSYALFVHNASAAHVMRLYTRRVNLTLRKYLDGELEEGAPVFVVTRKGEILVGFSVAGVLGDLVALNKSPLGGEKQGFTLTEGLLKPNWCEGRKAIVAACFTREEAERLASRRR